MRRSAMRSIPLAVAVLLLGTRAALASAIVFSNFGPGQSYDAGLSWSLEASGAPGFETDLDVAMGFVAGANYTLDSIALAAGFDDGRPNELDVSLRAESGGLPGAVLESWTFTTLGPEGSANPPLTALSVLHPALQAGTEYWLVADLPEPSTEIAGWNTNSIGDLGPVSFNTDLAGWEPAATLTRGAFEIDGTPTVPEPMSLVLVGSGLVAVVRRRKGV